MFIIKSCTLSEVFLAEYTYFLYHQYIPSESISFIQQTFMKRTLPATRCGDTVTHQRGPIAVGERGWTMSDSHTGLKRDGGQCKAARFRITDSQHFLLSAMESTRKERRGLNHGPSNVTAVNHTEHGSWLTKSRRDWVCSRKEHPRGVMT